jgi:hypothetical protein
MSTDSATPMSARALERVHDAVGAMLDRLAEPHRRLLVRGAAGLVAGALVITLAVLVLSGRTTERSAEAYCSRMADTRDLGDVLATGDSADIAHAVRRLESADRVAPVEIEPAMSLFAGYASELSDAVASSGKDEASMAAALQAAIVAQNDRADEVAAAVVEVDDYVGRTCGYTLTPKGGPGPADAGSGT